MACPFFFPIERFADKAWSKPPRLPLGDPYQGVCYVDPMREWRPDEATLRQACNVGYVRQRCSRFPKDAAADAVRFSALSETNGTLNLYYVIEKNYTPLEHGPLEYSILERRFLRSHSSALVLKQAQAYVESYLRRKSEPQDQANNPHRR